MAQPCPDCGTKHKPGECPMVNGSPGRKSRRKSDGGQPRNRKNQSGKPKIAAHKSNWSLIGEVWVVKKGRWFSNWRCTHCSRTRFHESTAKGARPPVENHEATY